jgi:hypothetical protein
MNDIKGIIKPIGDILDDILYRVKRDALETPSGYLDDCLTSGGE